MKKIIVGAIVLMVLCLGTKTGTVSAQRAPGPEPRHGVVEPPRSVRHQMKGFCYSGRSQTCSSIFARDTEIDISQECANTGWHKYYAFQHGNDAQFQHNQVCRN